MSTKSFFDCGDVIKLKKDLADTNLKHGDYGIVWAVYAYRAEENKEILEFDYEGSFWDKEGNYDDSMFEEEDAEKVSNYEEAPFSEKMKELLLYLNRKENQLHK